MVWARAINGVRWRTRRYRTLPALWRWRWTHAHDHPGFEPETPWNTPGDLAALAPWCPSWVVVGSGPSVQGWDPREAREAGVGILVLNGAYRVVEEYGLRADVLMMTDPNAVREYGREAARWADRSVWSLSAAHKGRYTPEGAILFRQWERPGMDEGHFQEDPKGPLFHAQSVAHAALQVLVMMGARNIAFVGVDLRSGPQGHYGIEATQKEHDRVTDIFASNRNRMVAAFHAARAHLDQHRPEVRVVRILVQGLDSDNPFPPMGWGEFLDLAGATPSQGLAALACDRKEG